ncbi:MAG: sulfatase-like hydrolase/transferase [Candidatus Latescibacteria bacterium]|nr:sulfatase-like hydrolase/transferase [Candidatus Latescibacterota bacterium]
MLRKPNVILLLTDDQGYGDLGCHGNPVLRTPHLDRLYGHSVRLTDYHVEAMCAPTRAALMTGRYPARTGVWSTLWGRYIMRRDESTLGDIFSAAGYRTGLFGKWHLGDNYPYRPQDRGFAEVLSFGGGVIGEIPDYWNNDNFTATYLHNGRPQRHARYCTDIWFSEAMKFIEAAPEAPFFCYISTNAPHSPFDIDEKYSLPYLRQGIPQERARFYGMIANIDENVGRLRAGLEARDLDRDTILIFMGDNGTAAGTGLAKDGFPTDGFNAGMRGKKTWVYDGGHRNACFFHWPQGDIVGGRDVDRLTAHIDILPTLVDLCGLEPGAAAVDGASLAPLLRRAAIEWPDRAVIVHQQQVDKPVKYKDFTVMTDRWRLVRTGRWRPPRTSFSASPTTPANTSISLSTIPRWSKTWCNAMSGGGTIYRGGSANTAKLPLVQRPRPRLY